MAQRDAEQIIASAVQRGAIGPERADYWREQAEDGEDISVLDTLAAVRGPQPVRAGAPVAAASLTAPSGADPALYASNPILFEMQRDKPALVNAAMAENPNPPRLFDSTDLPPFTASGLPPQQLASLPWPLRRPVAEAATLSAAYELVQGTDDVKLLELRYSQANAPYVSAMSQWLMGSGRTADGGPQPGSQPRHPATGQYVKASGAVDREDRSARIAAAAADDAADYVGQALYDELFSRAPK
jgi:hypothetical protein